MYYKLHEKLLLRGWQKLPYAIVEKGYPRPLFIKAIEMQALQLCNGRIDLSLPIVPQEIRDLLPLIEARGLIALCEPGDSIAPEQEYRCYPARYIRTAHWSITGRCNYRCKHCYMSAPDAKYGELSHGEIMSIVQQLIDCGVLEVSLTGGEPLVRRDFLEIVDALLAGGIHISTIYSNGRLVNDRLLDELEKRGIHPEFNMSYDGVDGWHDWLRGIDGAGRIAEEAFRRCRDRGFPTGAEMCVHKGNRHLLRETVRKLGGLGCRSLKVVPVSDVGAWKEGGYDAVITPEELYQTYLEYIPHYYADGMPLSLQLSGFFSVSPDDPDVYDAPCMKNCSNPDRICVCGHARQVMYISAERRALPCMFLSGMDIQNEFPLITELGLAACITDSRYMRLIDTRAGALETTPDDILAVDQFTCRIFRQGWIPKIKAAVKQAAPHVRNVLAKE